jgi:hypothetical protein
LEAGKEPGSVSGPKMYDPDASWAKMSVGNLQLYQQIATDGNTLKFRTYTAIGDLLDSFDIEKTV